MAGSSKHSSRFSTLKVFKFAGSKPPPPPPKDAYYLTNRSLASLSHSLSPDSFSLPPTPHLPQYVRSPSPTPTSTAVSPSPVDSTTTEATAFKKGLIKFGSFAKRPYATRANQSMVSLRSEEPQPQQDSSDVSDDGISMPWNFQHHLHVDENMRGLPPSWSASLADAGLSEEEIAAIQARRVRSPTSATSCRPQSPSTQSPVPHPVLANPHPRTTSLPRTYSNTSLSQRSRSGTASSRRAPGIRKNSDASRQFSDVSSSDLGSALDGQINDQDVTISARFPNSHTQESSTLSPSVQSSFSFRTPSEKNHPTTPPQRTFRIVNDSPGTSPPPAYASPSVTKDEEDVMLSSFPPPPSPTYTYDSRRETLRVSPRQIEHASRGEGHEPNKTLAPSPPVSPVKRFSVVPPRLSLGEDSLGDLASWSESLFSSIPEGLTGGSSSSSATSTSSLSGSVSAPSSYPNSFSSRPTPVSRASSSASSSTNRTHQRRPSKPVPLVVVKHSSREEYPSSTATTPLFDELLDMVQVSSASSPSYNSSPYNSSPRTPYTPALSERNSLVIPPSPYQGLSQRPEAQEPHEEGEDEESPLSPLSPDIEERRGRQNRDSNRSSQSTMTVTSATIVRGAAFATRAIAEVITQQEGNTRRSSRIRDSSATAMTYGFDADGDDTGRRAMSPPSPRFPSRTELSPADSVKTTREFRSASPQSTRSSSPSHSSGSSSSMTMSTFETEVSPRPTLALSGADDNDGELDVPPKSPGLSYLDGSPGWSPEPSPAQSHFGAVQSVLKEFESFGRDAGNADLARRPSIAINGIGLGRGDEEERSPPSASSSSSRSPLTPAQRYPGWLYQVVRPLEDFIDDAAEEPRELFGDLQEIAEGESGSVYCARYNGASQAASFVAIKQIPILPSGSPKLKDLQRELTLMKGVRHENVLTMDSLYVDLVEDSLWIRMELMERSLADVIALVEEGIELREEAMARFANDVLSGLDYLQTLNIAHRDVRSDNMLLNPHGVLKIADFSNAVQVAPNSPTCSEVVGVIYWQAPEIRAGPYNALKVDVWSLGATVWEMAQAEPPFSEIQNPREIGDQWPPLYQPEDYSRSFHDFLDLCSEPSSVRLDPYELSQTPFIRTACTRSVIVQLLADCRDVEEKLHRRQSDSSHGTIS